MKQNAGTWLLPIVLCQLSGCRTASVREGDGDGDHVVSTTLAVSWEYAPDSVPDLAKKDLQSALNSAGAAKGKSVESLLDKMTIQRLAGATHADVVASARELIMASEGKPLSKDSTFKVNLELALSAIQNDRPSAAAYYLSKVKETGIPAALAAELTAEGVLAMKNKDFSLAAASWRQALRFVPTYKAARINLGYLLLRNANASEAKTMLEPYKADWFAAAGLISAGRMLGDSELVDTLCADVLVRQPSHGPSLLNCALQAVQAKKDYARADLLLSRLVSTSTRPELTEYAFLLRNKFRRNGSSRIKVSSARDGIGASKSAF